MGLVNPAQGIAENAWKPGEFHYAEVVTVFFEITPRTLKRLLPPPPRPGIVTRMSSKFALKP